MRQTSFALSDDSDSETDNRVNVHDSGDIFDEIEPFVGSNMASVASSIAEIRSRSNSIVGVGGGSGGRSRSNSVVSTSGVSISLNVGFVLSAVLPLFADNEAAGN